MTTPFAEKKVRACERLGLPENGIPRHIAIIMDGNGRWATERGLSRFEGHREGGKTVEKIVQRGVDVGVECMTLYSFSMQNWRRPKEEIDYLMHLYSRYLVEIRPMLMDQSVRLLHLGQRQRLPEMVLRELDESVRITQDNEGMVLGLALNYGARTEIVDAVQRIAGACKSGEIKLEDICDETIDSHLYTAGLPDPDLVIRTSGEMRISNFLLWQISYAEFYVTETYWPDFEPEDLDTAIQAYAARSRRFGDVKSKTTG